jgi:predicted DNA-binding ribbon-helix-helix protein
MTDELLKNRTFRLGDKLWTKLVREAKKKRIGVTLLIRHIIEDHYKK